VTSLAALQADDPQRVGPYLLLGRLGSGGMGWVYLARSPGGRQVAVKVIWPQLAEDDSFRARFAREVSAARKVGGLFTAQVVDADLDSPLPWLVTAYVPGASLAEAVEKQRVVEEAGQELVAPEAEHKPDGHRDDSAGHEAGVHAMRLDEEGVRGSAPPLHVQPVHQHDERERDDDVAGVADQRLDVIQDPGDGQRGAQHP